jgi:predicted O-linked N-acetylglucosamine transferase (SPINDLY family)
MRMHGRTPPRPAASGPIRPVAVSEEELRRRIAADPSRAADWQQLGNLCAAGNRHAEAADAYARAIEAGASAVALAGPRALALSGAGRAAEAVQVAAAAQARRPKDFALTNLLGVLLKRAGRLEDAVPVLEAARRLDPRSISPLQNLGNVYELLGRPRDAGAAFQAALKLSPRDGEVHRLHGRALLHLGDAAAAAQSLERALSLDPQNRPAFLDLIGALLELRQFDRAAAWIARVGEARPGDDEVLLMQARLLIRTGRIAEAKAVIESAIAANPRNWQSYLMLARQHGDGNRKAANETLRRGLDACPGDPRLLADLIDSLSRSRYSDEGEHIEASYALACQLLAEHPGAARQHSKPLRTIFMRCLDVDRLDATGALQALAPAWVAENNVAALHYELGRVATLEDRIQIVEWHRAWGRRTAASIVRAEPLAMPALSGGRPVRVGFMSSDLRTHPVSYFALQLLEMFDRERFEVFCYSFYEGARDKVQAHIEAQVTGFRWWPRKPDADVADGIAADGLDILFELGGSTAMNKLNVMAYRPARIGASWLGYPHSAGFEQIDLILTDPYIRPDDPRLLIERPFELPESWVSLGRLGFHDAPIDPDLPELRRGYLTFGTMNNPYKMTRACLDGWAAVLRAVPGSRFLFVRPEGRTKPFVENARTAFASRDVDPDRLEFIGIRGDHLKHYNAIDIALDSFPHTGGTTTCETLWMGVPVVAMIGPGFPERLSYSNLSNAGLGELAVRSVDDYVATAVALAADRPRRRRLRHGLRDMIRSHPLGQVECWVQGFYAKVEEVVRA